MSGNSINAGLSASKANTGVLLRCQMQSEPLLAFFYFTSGAIAFPLNKRTSNTLRQFRRPKCSVHKQCNRDTEQLIENALFISACGRVRRYALDSARYGGANQYAALCFRARRYVTDIRGIGVNNNGTSECDRYQVARHCGRYECL